MVDTYSRTMVTLIPAFLEGRDVLVIERQGDILPEAVRRLRTCFPGSSFHSSNHIINLDEHMVSCPLLMESQDGIDSRSSQLLQPTIERTELGKDAGKNINLSQTPSPDVTQASLYGVHTKEVTKVKSLLHKTSDGATVDDTLFNGLAGTGMDVRKISKPQRSSYTEQSVPPSVISVKRKHSRRPHLGHI